MTPDTRIIEAASCTSPDVQTRTFISPSSRLPKAEERAAPKGRIIQLDFARGIAICMVMTFHYGAGWTGTPFLHVAGYIFDHVGWMGVDLFFVLSGFLVGGLLVRELINTGNLRVRRFLARRVLKIWPAYYFYILFEIVIRRHPLGTFIWQNILNIQNYAGTSLTLTWSLAVEEHFYLLVPFALLGLYKHPRLRSKTIRILLACSLLVLAVRVVEIYHFRITTALFHTHDRIDSLLFGVILSHCAYTYPAHFGRLLKQRLLFTVICVAGVSFALSVSRLQPLMPSFGYTVNYLWLASLLLLIYGYRGTLTETWVYRAVAWVGLYSYGIYLWHLAIREPLVRVASHFPALVRPECLMLIECAAAIILGVLTTKAIELPMLRLRERLVPPVGSSPSSLIYQQVTKV